MNVSSLELVDHVESGAVIDQTVLIISDRKFVSEAKGGLNQRWEGQTFLGESVRGSTMNPQGLQRAIEDSINSPNFSDEMRSEFQEMFGEATFSEE